MRRRSLLILGGLVVAAAVGAVLLVGRGSAGPPAVHVRLAVLDGILRKPGETCSGGGGFLYIHESGPWSIADPADGSVLTRGSLPTGDAERIGKPIQGAAVEPTICVLSFSARIPVRERYVLHLGGEKAIPFARTAIRPDGSLRVQVQ